MIEEWRPIEGYEGLYEVSNTGQVRSLDRYVKNGHSSYRLQKGRVLSPTKDRYGYLFVILTCNGKHKMFLVHRLVAQAFILNPDNLPQVNHKDEDKTNNRVDNLEWCDAKYNNNYGSRKDKVRDTKIKNGYWTGLIRKESMKKYYQENRDRICEKQKEYAQKYYQENKDRICEQKKEYYRKRKEQIQNNVKSLDDQI